MSKIELETARLLARFKLQARRNLDMVVDLVALVEDRHYADVVLRQVEDGAEDEELLLLAIRLRDCLGAQRLPPPVEVPANDDMAEPRRPVRDYRFGARCG
jgi:hypothetical protein